MQLTNIRVLCVSVILATLPGSAVRIVASGSLFDAIRRDDSAAVGAALDAGADVNAAADGGATPMMYAALYADPRIIRQLIDRGADVNVANEFGATALMWASPRTENVKALLAGGADLGARASNGWTPLVAATRFGNTDAMKVLMAAGADATAPRDRRNLLTAAYFAANPDARNLLRDLGVVVTSPDDVAGPVLDRMRDDPPTLVSLLDKGLNPREEVPLITLSLPSFFMAARDGQVDAMRAFVAKGMSPTYKGARGTTALTLAAGSDKPTIPALRYLLDNGADVNDQDADGRTALDWALTRGETEVASFLRSVGGRTHAIPVPAPAHVASPRIAREAIEKALVPLQAAGPGFSDRAKCNSCHNQNIPGIAVALAQRRGLQVDEALAGHSIEVTERNWSVKREPLLLGDNGGAFGFNAQWSLLELIEGKRAPTLNADAAVVGLASRQLANGSWDVNNEIRPPLNGTNITATALALRGISAFPPVVYRPEIQRRVARARAFLKTATPGDTQEHVFKLLGLVWSDAGELEIDAVRTALLELQRKDGGWGQMPTLESDAFATGQALYALHAAGVPPAASTYRRGVDYLLRTQLEDGTWFVRTRAFGVQPYFETGFPHGKSQFISTTATAWAAIALTYTVAPVAKADDDSIVPSHRH